MAQLFLLTLTAIYVVGLLDRNRTFLRMGYDSLAAIVTYGVGIGFLGLVGATS